MSQQEQEKMAEVEKVLETLRGGFILHGGNIELVSIDLPSGKVHVRLEGSCVGCPMADMTIKAGVEETLKEMVEGVTEVIQVP
jgi:Fe-S cluster biogenesis protein NfuA